VEVTLITILETLTKFPDVKILVPKIHHDYRGHFFESFIEYELLGLGITHKKFVQDNESLSNHSVLRGLHFQKKHPQEKLIRVVKGLIWNVVVDIRLDSPTFGQWEGGTLDSIDHHQVFVPSGFAHGFVVLSAGAYVLYKCSDFYYEDDQHGILFSDQDLNIPWQNQLSSKVIVSEQDKRWPTLAETRKELITDNGKLPKRDKVPTL
jgi:dTDP-4-dehydrorhamnose 3,5-epimerase